jgi:small nuclear ribonucleoprotein (snRNP)-like protein
MNVQLSNVEEWIDGAMAGKLGDEVLIRYFYALARASHR